MLLGCDTRRRAVAHLTWLEHLRSDLSSQGMQWPLLPMESPSPLELRYCSGVLLCPASLIYVLLSFRIEEQVLISCKIKIWAFKSGLGDIYVETVNSTLTGFFLASELCHFHCCRFYVCFSLVIMGFGYEWPCLVGFTSRSLLRTSMGSHLLDRDRLTFGINSVICRIPRCVAGFG